jgi:hypothetical protein
MKEFPPVEITLPWKVADGPPVTKRLIFTGPRGGHVWRLAQRGGVEAGAGRRRGDPGPRAWTAALIGTAGGALALWAHAPSRIAVPVALLIVLDVRVRRWRRRT